MELIGYIAAALIGISLGLIGGGGSILTVPVLVYLFGIYPALATSYSLFIVGSTSLVGAYSNFRKGQVVFPVALLFGLSSIITVIVARRFIVPALPDQLFNIGAFQITKSLATMVLFASLMLAAAVSMINGSAAPQATAKEHSKAQLFRLPFYGVGIGLVTGLLGAGGGFLLIPALVFFLRLPMKKAVGTSLFIIAMNSLIGFLADLGQYATDWIFLLKISALAIAGIIAGGRLGRHIPGEKLKKGFGWFVLLMGIFIIARELF